MRGRLAGVCAAGASGLAVALVLAVGAQAHRTGNPVMYVNFFAGGSITVTLADGTAVGASSGTPTEIPAGYYTLEFSGPGGCSVLPYFRLSGPGVNIVTNGNEGQVVHPPSSADFQPSATYAWSDDAVPGVVNQFTTSSQVVGSATASATQSNGGTGATISSQDVVGSAELPFAGSLSATIGASGSVTLRHDGRAVSRLESGRYTLVIVSKDSRSGFTIERPATHTVALARGAFSGRRSIPLSLSSGRWVFSTTAGASSSFVVG